MPLMDGAQALIEVLRREQVEYIFGIPGATEVVLMDALAQAPDIRYRLCLHETVAAGMAEGYARISGKPGIVNVHTNTGLSAALPLMYNALQGGVPLIVTAGQQDKRLAAAEPALQADLTAIARPFTKWSTEIVNAADIPLVMRQAFKVALYPPRGPVFVAIPQNLLQQTCDFEYVPGSAPYVKALPDPAALQKAAALLLEAENPLLLVEDGITQNEALAEVVALAELCGAAVYQQWMADVNFPTRHPLYCGDIDVNSAATREMLQKYDVLVVLGSLFFCQAVFTEKSIVPPGLKIIQIDDDAWQLAKNYPVDVAVQSNLKIALPVLSRLYQEGLSVSDKRAVAERKKRIASENNLKREGLHKKAAAEFEHVPMAVSSVMQIIKEECPAGVRIVDDCWSASAVLRQTLDLKEPLSYLRARGGGSIGWGLPGALGVKLADPERPVLCISGDGSAMWSIQTLWTAAHYKIPVIYLILANAAFRQVRIMKNKILRDNGAEECLGTDLSDPRIDFCGLANSLGLSAQKAEDPQSLRGLLKEAFKKPQLCLIEAAVDDKL